MCVCGGGGSVYVGVLCYLCGAVGCGCIEVMEFIKVFLTLTQRPVESALQIT